MRLIGLAALGIVAVVTTGCNAAGKVSTGSLAPSTVASPAASAPTAPKTFAIGDKVETPLGNFVTLYGVQPNVPPPDSFSAPSPGTTLYAVDVQACAGPNAASYNELYFALQMADNTKADADLLGQKSPRLGSGVLAPGQCARGWVTFDVPTGAVPTQLILNPLGSTTVITWKVA